MHIKHDDVDVEELDVTFEGSCDHEQNSESRSPSGSLDIKVSSIFLFISVTNEQNGTCLRIDIHRDW